jgi:hypothetical protein
MSIMPLNLQNCERAALNHLVDHAAPSARRPLAPILHDRGQMMREFCYMYVKQTMLRVCKALERTLCC